MSENINQNTEQPTTHTPEASGGQGENRTFTQEEVNRIVSERLAREREKLTQPKEDEREQALKAREAKLDCREYLDAQGYPAALLDVLDSSDTAKFKASVEKLAKVFPALMGAQRPTFEGWKPGESTRRFNTPDPIAGAFKPKT